MFDRDFNRQLEPTLYFSDSWTLAPSRVKDDIRPQFPVRPPFSVSENGR